MRSLDSAYVFLVICSLVRASLEENPIQIRSKILETQDFRLRARVNLQSVIPRDTKFEMVELNERYSIEQKRAVIEYEGYSMSSGQIRRGRYYCNGANHMLATDFIAQKSCRSASYEDFGIDIFGRLSEKTSFQPVPLTGELWFEKHEGVPNYVIGTARLLLLVDVYRDKLVKVDGKNRKIRGHNVEGYNLNIAWGRSRTVNMFVYFNQDDLSWTGSSIPLRISVQFTPSIFMYVDFLIVEPFRDNASPIDSERLQYRSDPFSFPIGLECSSKLQPTDYFKLVRLPRVVSMRTVRRTPMFRKLINVFHRFIAYDGRQRVLRTDTYGADESNSNQYHTSILDIKFERRYNIERWFKRDDNGLVTFDLPGSCVATKSYKTNLEPIFKFNQMVEMGQATVRGVKSIVFEQISDHLPEIFFHKFSATSSASKDEITSSYDIEFSIGLKGPYTIVYYFALPSNDKSNQSHVGPLMRLDVHHDGHLQSRIDVYDFKWHQLSDAPNGDHQTELFSLKDYCGGDNNRIDKSSQLYMELEYVTDMQRSRISTPQVTGLLDNPTVRNIALMRALNANSKITAPQIYNFRSQIRKIGNKLHVLMSAKLSNIKDEIFEAKLLGTGRPSRALQTTKSMTFEQCFLAACRMRKMKQVVVFSYVLDECYVDDEATLDPQSGQVSETKFKILKITNYTQRFGDVYTIDVYQERTPNLPLLWRSIYNDLTEKMLPVPLINEMDKTESLLFEVARLELTNNKWSLNRDMINGGSSNEDENVLSGVGFVGKEDGDDDVVDDNTSSINMNTCHSRCVANWRCRSFSICLRSGNVECSFSEIQFSDPNLLKKIREETDNAKKSNKRRFKIKYSDGREVKNESNFTDDISKKGSIEIELKLDLRCRIYNRRALDMFEILPKSPTLIENANILEVQDEEECAEICLRKNLNYFKRLKKLNGKVTTSNKYYNRTSGTDTTKRKQSVDRVEFWCAIFKYLDLKTSSVSDDVVKLLGKTELKKDGLCLLPGRKISLKSSSQSNPNEMPSKETSVTVVGDNRIKMDAFQFVYSNLYERQYGIRMLSYEEEEQSHSNDSMKLVVNRQKLHIEAEIEQCALSCFSQSAGLKPSCKSFDFIEVKVSYNSIEKPFKIRYCLFNSMTVSEAKRTGHVEKLVTNREYTDEIHWHFEPKQEFFLENEVLDNIHSLVDTSGLISDHCNGLRLHTWSILLVTLVASISGLIFGIYLKHPIENRWLIRANVDSIGEILVQSDLSDKTNGIK